MTKMKRRNKVLIIAGAVLGALTLLIAGAGMYLQSHADELIAREFSKLTKGRYRLDAGRIEVSLFNRSVTLNDIVISPDSAAVADGGTAADSAAIADGKAAAESPRMQWALQADRLFIAGVSYGKKDGKLNASARKLQLQRPRVSMTQLPHPAPEADSAAAFHPIRIDIGKIIISEGYVEHRRLDQNDTTRNVVENFELRTDGFLIDNTADPTGAQSLFGANTRLTVGKVSHMPKDQATRLELDSLYIETATGELRFSSFAQIPTYTKDEFARMSWRHKDWTRFAIGRTHFTGVDYARLLKTGAMHIDSISVADGGLSSYKNRNVRRTEWVKPLFHQMIQQLPLRFAVRTAHIARFDAQYEELALGETTPGIIRFNGIEAHLTNLTNIPSDEPWIKLVATAGMMNDAGHVSTTVFLPVDPLNQRWEIMAIVGPFDMRAFNPMVTPLAPVSIQNGIADRLDMHIVANDTKATIDLTFLYHDIKVAILKKEGGQLEERRFLSRLANSLVLLHSNPLHNQVRKGHAEYTRDPYKSAFNFIWKTVFQGVKNTMGL